MGLHASQKQALCINVKLNSKGSLHGKCTSFAPFAVPASLCMANPKKLGSGNVPQAIVGEHERLIKQITQWERSISDCLWTEESPAGSDTKPQNLYVVVVQVTVPTMIGLKAGSLFG